MPETMRLYTFAISHFSEKIRFALDASGLAYEEIVWTPVLHIPRALLKSRQHTTVPILEADGEVIQDSTAILHWLIDHRAPFPLVPSDARARAEALAIEERFDRVGKHVIRYVYAEALHDPDAVVDFWTERSAPLVRGMLGRAFPLLVPGLKRRFGIHPKGVEASRAVIAEGLDWLAERVADGRAFLVGDALTLADVTAAALLAPLACPAEHPIYGSSAYRAAVRTAVGDWEAHPALAWVRALYARARRVKAA